MVRDEVLQGMSEGGVHGAHERVDTMQKMQPGKWCSVKSGQVRSGQVRSECLTCAFKASCCSARLSRAQVPAFAASSVRDRKKRGGGREYINLSVFLCIYLFVFLCIYICLSIFAHLNMYIYSYLYRFVYWYMYIYFRKNAKDWELSTFLDNHRKTNQTTKTRKEAFQLGDVTRVLLTNEKPSRLVKRKQAAKRAGRKQERKAERRKRRNEILNNYYNYIYKIAILVGQYF